MKGRENFWGETYNVSKRQIEFAINLNMYRQSHNMSLQEMAHICSLYGEPHGIKFNGTQICAYENMRHAPRKVRFQILCNVLDMEKPN